jgi:hypothetical protein
MKLFWSAVSICGSFFLVGSVFDLCRHVGISPLIVSTTLVLLAIVGVGISLERGLSSIQDLLEKIEETTSYQEHDRLQAKKELEEGLYGG